MPHIRTEDERKAAAIMALALNFNKELPEPLAHLWMHLLQPYSAKAVEMACIEVVRNYKFKTLPPFAVIQEYLPKGVAPLDEAKMLALKASAEWDELLNDIHRCGYYNEPEHHPTTDYVLHGMGGWPVVCLWKEDELHWRKKEFIEAWMQADGYVEDMRGGATAIERRQAQIALGTGDDRTLKRIERNVVERLRQRGQLPEGEEVEQ